MKFRLTQVSLFLFLSFALLALAVPLVKAFEPGSNAHAAANTQTDLAADARPLTPDTLAFVGITGPLSGTLGVSYTFTATVSPQTLVLPITYTWQASGQPLEQHVGGISDTLAWSWTDVGCKTITVTAANASHTVSDTHVITIETVIDPLAAVTISGPSNALLGADYAFSAAISPTTTLLPITYTWQTTGQPLEQHVGGVSDTLTLSWADLGRKIITVTAENETHVVSDTHVVNVAAISLTVAGPTSGVVKLDHAFTATVGPATVVPPITYTWQASGQPPQEHVGDLEDVVVFNWSDPGAKIITVTAANCGHVVTGVHTVALAIEPKYVYLPIVFKHHPNHPGTPSLNPIDNPDQDSNYIVSWTGDYDRTEAFTLQEDKDTHFDNPREVYVGPDISWLVNAKPAGTYYYRVKASNAWGSSAWSNVRSVVVQLSVSEDIVNGDFENGPVDWFQYSAHSRDLIVSELLDGVTPHSESWAVWLGAQNQEVSFIQQQVTVPADRPYLSYWHWIVSEDECGNDLGGVVINGSALVEIYPLCQPENTDSWVQHVVDLGAYAGQLVSLQIRAETNDSLPSHLFIDDVTFQSDAP